MEADAGPVPIPVPAPSSEQGPDPEEGAQALAEFAALHGPALRASGVPERYWGRLLHKLEHEVRAGATWGGRGAGPGAPGCRAGPVRAGVARSGPFHPEWSGLRACPWPRTAGFSAWEASWVHLGKAGRPHGGHVRMRLEVLGELLVCKRVAGTGSLCPAGQASVRRTGVSLGSWGRCGQTRPEKQAES